MKILLFGKTGQLGSAILKDAITLGHTIIAPSKEKLDFLKKDYLLLDMIYYHEPDVIINTAAFTDTLLCEIDSIKAFQLNCIAVNNIGKICKDLDIQFVTFSTDYVFDGTKEKPYIEEDKPFPLQTYGLSKLCGEYTSLSYGKSIVIRTSGLYGKSKKGNFVDNRIKESFHSTRIEISNDQTTSPTYTEDLSEATLNLIVHPKKEYGIYHLVNEGYCTWYELTKEIFNILDIKCEVIPINREGRTGKMRRPLFSALENTKAKKLGIVLPHWKDALKRYLELNYK